MKLSITVISIVLTSALGASIKRQNDVPNCINGDISTINMPGGGCSEGCFMTEQEGDRVGQICAGNCVATSLALLSLPTTTQAQGSDSLNLNLTLRFFTSSQDDCCDLSATSQALTFTTNSIPVLPVCFDLVDLFGGNATSGFVNQTGNQPNVIGEKGIH
ncbi:hypothetical protein E8E13_008476 [Curvularia kusanoi]|uniref:Uncharacterized protein n=1 Tax=Curvularia kusanoi TaxID=90978 RepID=A0A9P4TBF0_CURKU|nr:hypothetical protein E8E13_008476 [Curvularia kusanoi]